MIFFKNFSERSANNDYWPATWSLSGKVVANKGQRSVASDLREKERERVKISLCPTKFHLIYNRLKCFLFPLYPNACTSIIDHY